MSPRITRRFRFTNASVRALKATDTKGERYTDALLAGLGVTVYPDGRRVFFLRYGPRNRRRFLTLGTFGLTPGLLTVDAARSMAQDILARYRINGDDPVRELRRSAAVPTFAEWVAEYMPRRRRLKKTAGREATYLKTAEEYFGPRALDEVTTADVEKAREEIADTRGVVTSNRWLAALRACYKAAVTADVIQRDPTQGVELFNEARTRRPPRQLTDDELAALIKQIDRLDDPYQRAVFLLLIGTGTRKGEALSARWENVDLEAGTWRLPETKSGRRQLVFLAPPVVDLLRSLPRVEGSPWVFPSRTKPRRHMTAIDATFRELRVRAGVPDVVIHDLRDALGERVKRTSDLQTASEALRHANINTTAEHYAPAGEERIRGALARAVGDVIPFPSTHERNEGGQK